MKLYFFTLLLVSVLLGSSFLVNAQADGPAPAPAPDADICDEKCNVRCAKAGFYKRCYKYCYMCCSKCDYCVPSGTYGNRDECPCYRDMVNSKGKQKCP